MLTRLLGVVMLSGGLLIVTGGCYGGEGGGEAESAAVEVAAESMAEMQQPDTVGSAVVAYLGEADYQNSWQLWPGKGELYEGTEPHGMLLTTYLNPAALDALTSGAGSMPAGAIIVKENYMPDGTLAAITTMFKVAEYNAEAGDWFWLKHGPDGTIEVEGRGAGCIACHSTRSDNDLVFTGSLSGDGM